MRSWLTKLFEAPPATVLAAQELAEAKRLLLVAQTQAEHYKHRVAFPNGLIDRLSGYEGVK